MANWLTRILPSWASRSAPAEGAYRPGPYLLEDGWISANAGKLWNFWQHGVSPQSYGEASAMTEACISAYSQTVAMCPGNHWTTKEDGGRVRVSTSALARVLRRPNDYQSISDLLLNLTRRLYEHGEVFAYAVRNNRGATGGGEITELHLMRYGMPLIGSDGSIFYWLSGNEIADYRFDLSEPVPARDVLHIRLHTPRHPLKGVSPILATTLERAMAGAALNQQVAFYLNQARPSYILQTDQNLTAEQTAALRARWDEQTQGENAGKTPILTNGFKAEKIALSAADSQLADMLKMTDQSVALAFRIPLQVLGVGNTPFASTAALISAWKSSGLGFALNHIEEAIGYLFGLKGQPDEYLEFDTEYLLRSNFEERMKGWQMAVKSGLSINEFRKSEGYAAVDGGDEPRVQMQDVPISQWKPNMGHNGGPPLGGDDNSPPEKTAEVNLRAVKKMLRKR